MSHMGHVDRNLEAGVDKRGKHSRAPCGARGLKFCFKRLILNMPGRAPHGARGSKCVIVFGGAFRIYAALLCEVRGLKYPW